MDLDHLKLANRVFEQLAALPPEQALAALQAMDGLEAPVVEWVQRLIHNAHQPSEVFEQQVASVYRPTSGWGDEDLTGQRLGEYELLEKIGQGGMSQVYRAQRVNAQVQKPVALKVFSPQHHGDELKRRFLAEQRMLSSLSHPHIVAMQYGETANSGHPFIVMELVEGAEPVTTHVARRGLSQRAAMRLVIQAAEALAHAHNNLIIHRDIKPSNVIVGADGVLKIVDFGIAKLLSSEQPDNHNTLLAMTPQYAAPEQILGGRITVATDVFSLAALAACLLSGEDPLPHNRIAQSCRGDTAQLRAVLKRAGVDRDLGNVLNKAMHEEPGRRYSHMQALADDLRAWLQHKPVSATPDSMAYRLFKFAERRRALFISLTALTLTVLVGIAALSWQYRQTRVEAQKAQAVKQFMLDAFSVTDPDVNEGVDISARDVLDIARVRLDAADNLDASIRHELLQALGLSFGRLGYLTRASDLLIEALRLKPDDGTSLSHLALFLLNSDRRDALQQWLGKIDEAAFENAADRARVQRVRALLHAQNGEYQAALDTVNTLRTLPQELPGRLETEMLAAEIYYLMGESERSVAVLKAAKAQSTLRANHTLHLGMNTDLIHYYDRLGEFGQAIQLSLETAEQYRSLLGERHPQLGAVLNELSVFHRLAGDLKAARTVAQQSRDLFFNLYGEHSAGLAQALSHLGMVDYLEFRHDAAIQQFTQSRDILVHVFGQDHPETLSAEANLATILNAVGRSVDALPLLQHVFSIERQTLGENHRNTLLTEQSLALTLASAGRLLEARRVAESNVQRSLAHFDATAPFVQNAQVVLARILLQGENAPSAVKLLQDLAAQWPDHSETRYYMVTHLLAQGLMQSGDDSAALARLEDTLAGCLEIYGAAHPETLSVQLDRAEVLQRLGRTEESDQTLQRIAEALSSLGEEADALRTRLQQLKPER